MTRSFADLLEGEPHDDGKTFGDALDHELKLSRLRGCEPATRRGYSYQADRWLRPKLGHIRLDDLRPEHFEELWAEMVAEGIASSTINKNAVTCRLALRHAERSGWIKGNPAKLAELPKRRERPKVWPVPDDVARFAKKAYERDRTVYDYAVVIAATGMRPGEACALRTDDLDGNELTIQRALDVCEGKARIKCTKTGKNRTLTVDDETARIIRSRPGPFVFGGSEPIRTDLMSKRFRRVARRAKVCFTPRNLRHYHATQLIAAGADIETVKARLGHSNSHTTAAFYLTNDARNDVKAADFASRFVPHQDVSE